MNEDIESILYTREQIAQRVDEIGTQITADYAGKELVVVGILRGAAPFAADLIRAVELPLELDFMALSSYGAASTSSGKVDIVKDLSSPVAGKHVVVVEDILDSGLTLDYVVKLLASRGAASVELAAFLVKRGAQRVSVDCKYVGFECPNAFIVGYGLDYAQRYRNLPYIGVLKPQVYASEDPRAAS